VSAFRRTGSVRVAEHASRIAGSRTALNGVALRLTPRGLLSYAFDPMIHSVERIASGHVLLMRGTLCAAALLLSVAAAASAQDGAALYKEHCSSCHDRGADRAPALDQLRTMPPQRILQALEFGSMVAMTHGRTTAERRAMSEYASGKTFDTPFTIEPSAKAMCTQRPATVTVASGAAEWSGFGQNHLNTRFQTARAAGLTAGDVPRLKLRWAFGLPGDVQSWAALTLVGGRLYTGSIAGNVYSLDAKTGCVYWAFNAGAIVRTAVIIGSIGTGAAGRQAAFFGDARGNAYALDAANGRLLWKVSVESFPVARITGSPVLHRGRLYVPVSSSEEGVGSLPGYECCRFRGSIVALDAANGKQMWKTYTIPEEPRPFRRNSKGTQLWGPSGAPIWSSPVIDEARGALYVTTGNNYSDPPSAMSDAFVAMDLETGRIRWAHQVKARDAYVSACRLEDKTNCPEANGPDFDFAASPILVSLPGAKRALVAGHKSGIVYAVDPDRDGARLWETRIGQGGSMGGVQWGSAADTQNVYVALSDVGRVMLTYTQFTDADRQRGGGMFALRLSDGARVWYTPPVPCDSRPRCSPAQSGAVSAIPGVAFAGSLDGYIRAYAADSGKVIWDFDTVRQYETVNGVPGQGGSLDGPGPIIGDGMLYVNSGYTVDGGMAGNVILAFSVEGK
jgi:polyvinyl alcohol dehydrogenase (cytochrome)